VDLPAPALHRFGEPPTGWRRAAIIAGGLAVLELIALVVVALAFVAKPFADEPANRQAPAASAAAEPDATAAPAAATPKPGAKPGDAAAAAQLPRTKTRVLVLNGNGYAGAASEKAAVIRSLRYPVAGIGDAARRDFPRTVVMYRTGFRGEAERLAKDLGMAASRAMPLDGMRPGELSGAQLVLVVGNAA
jgi:hypothetical protein